MTDDDKIEELLKRLPRASHCDNVSIAGFQFYTKQIVAFMREIAKHIDWTLKPPPDPCREAWKKLSVVPGFDPAKWRHAPGRSRFTIEFDEFQAIWHMAREAKG